MPPSDIMLVHFSDFFIWTNHSFAYRGNVPHMHGEKPKEGIALFQCPVCGELLEALTSIHCNSRHYLTKRELIARYGTPKYVAPRIDRAVQRWIRDAQVITRTDFDMAQAAARNQLRMRATNY